jgi:hypothetical protein
MLKGMKKSHVVLHKYRIKSWLEKPRKTGFSSKKCGKEQLVMLRDAEWLCVNALRLI